MPLRQIAISLLLALAAHSPAAAEDKPIAYQVEMLIFTHEDAAPMANGAPAEPLVGPQEAQQLSADQEGQYFRPLPIEELTLTTAGSLLQGSGRYEVIEHVAWRQPGLDERAAKPVHIHGGPEYRSLPAAADLGYESSDPYTEQQGPMTLEQLDGTIKVVLGQYLHVYTDLVFRKPVATQIFGDNAQPQRANALYEFKIQDHRRMRSKELHYIDHPLVGILVLITPVAEKAENQGPEALEPKPQPARLRGTG